MASTNNNSSTNKSKASSAEAMDALNLDDLFNDDPDDPFFDDVDMDLGDISGVFNEGGRDVMSQEFGRVGSVGSNRTTNAPMQSNNRQPVGKKRGSKVALTHAQIMANLGIKKEDEKKAKAVAASPIEKDEGGIIDRIRTRREARSSETDRGTSKTAGVIASNKNNINQNKVSVNIDTQAAIDALADYGIKPSIEFYPYMRLPSEIEIKKSQKAYPCLEKVIHASPANKNKLPTPENTNTHSKLYQLCTMHSGSHNETPSELERALGASTYLAKIILSQSHPLLPELKKELSKLLISVMKQSAFLRQNLWNMETYAKQEVEEAEFKSIFTICRKDMEDALTLIHRDGLKSLLLPALKENKPNGSIKLNLKPMIIVKAKVRVQGWRDKSGRRLVGRLKPPKEWKIATKRAKSLALKRQAEEEAAATPKMDPNVLKAVAAETLQSHIVIDTIQNKHETINTPSSDMKKPEATEKKKGPTRKRKSATLSSSTDTETPTSRIAKKLTTPHTSFSDLFHVPSYGSQRSSTFSTAHTTPPENRKNVEHSLGNTKLLHPALSPTERRIMLANEISSTVQRLENVRFSKQVTKAKEMQTEIKELEAVYKKDLETVPEVANTVGLWNWIEKTSYFRDFKREDVFDAMDCICVDSLDDPASSSSNNGNLWGSLLPPVSVQTNAPHERGNAIEQSPLFNCLQSLLVEVDGSDEELFDDDDLLGDLPPFTSEQMLHGPCSQTSVQDDEVLDVSRLSLDQRTYLQLRAVGLIDTFTHSTMPPTLVENAMTQKRPHSRITEMDGVIQNMKSDLSELESTNSSLALDLQQSALLNASQSLKGRKQSREQESILAKYNELKKEQEQNRRRISGRVKLGPAKFDGDNWLS